MSGDERGGPYYRDKLTGRRTPPREDKDRDPYWWELAVVYLIRYFWVALGLGVGVFLWSRMGAGG